MVFISDEQISKETKMEDLTKKIDAKKQQHYVNEKAVEKENNDLSSGEMFKVLAKAVRHIKQPKEQKITLKDIETQLKINELMEDKKEEVLEKMLEEPEMKEIKSEIISVMALPHTHEVRRRIFHRLLAKSDTVNNYVDDNVMFRFFNKANCNIKFGTVYALKYMQTFNLHRQYLIELEEERLQQQPKPQPQPPVEEVKEL